MINKKGVLGAAEMKGLLNYIFLLVAILVAIWFFQASRKDTVSVPDMGPRAMMQAEAPLVRVQKIAAKEITDTREYVGRVEAVDSVDLVARVSGYLESIDFVEGRNIKAGDLMFTIEKGRFRAEIEARKGTVLQIEANLVEAKKYLRRLRLPNGKPYPIKGEWDFIGTAIDTDTGTISLRSRYANPDGLLIPGGYVTVILSSVREEVLPLVPQAAVMESREGSYVYVMGKGDIAEMRVIQKRTVSGADWIVEEGIQPGEIVIVEGIQKVRPGQAVKIENGAAKMAPETGNK